MDSKIIHLELPLAPEDARNLALGDLVTVSGWVFTGRSQFHIRAVEDDLYPPIDYSRINCFFHSGPVMKKGPRGEWEIVSIEPTSSIRFEKYSGPVVEKFGLRTLIGKTTMGPGTAEALKKTGGVHLSKIGICGNQISQQVEEIDSVYFLEELGKTEATWVFRVNRFGPFFVDIDTRGNNYFQALDRNSRKSLPQIYRDLEIPEDFKYTEVG
ncbi:MAG: fumarate hydratase C-terminal domain-containing protein [Spirochaetia bacterium]